MGSPQDLSTTFYNPGGLARLETESFLLSAQAFEYQWLTAEESSGRFTDLSTDRLGTAPTLFAGTFPRSWTKGTLAYSFLTRQRFEFQINNWSEMGTTPIDSVATNSFIGASASEYWGGITWSRAAGDVGVGATLYGAYRSQRGRTELLGQPVPTGTPGVVWAVVNDYSYSHLRLLAKIGVYWNRGRTSFGVTVTTPGVGLFGEGKAAYYRSIVSADSATSIPTVTESAVYNDPSVQYESPASVAVGARLASGPNSLYATLEWFAAVDRYRVLDSPAVPVSGIGSSLGASLTQELRSVVNFAIGYEYSPREQLTFFGSFLTDFSSATGDASAAHSFSTWDIYQITGGAAFTFHNVDLTFGASFAAGGEAIDRQNDVGITPVLNPAEVRYRRIKVFIGFEFGK
ncbi:MAG: hypothetical protein ACYSWU_14980 [Planctomycetota bacterium]